MSQQYGETASFSDKYLQAKCRRYARHRRREGHAVGQLWVGLCFLRFFRRFEAFEKPIGNIYVR
jgi:hypothetical protein